MPNVSGRFKLSMVGRLNMLPSHKKFSEKVKWNIPKSITKKIGIPTHLFVKTLSALSDFENFMPLLLLTKSGE